VTPSLAVGIAGGTGAGKTTLARLLAATLGHATLLDLDSYYLDHSALSQKSRDRLNFDQPDAFDVPLLLEHLHQLLRGRPVEKPRYSFEHHTRCGFEPVPPAPIVLVEGLFALWWEDLRALLDLKVFLDAPSDLRLTRRLKRDVTDRGRIAESVLQQYEATVRPMHDLYVEPTRAHADLVLINDQDLPTCVSAVCTALRATSSKRL
jgi:uridine kinase